MVVEDSEVALPAVVVEEDWLLPQLWLQPSLQLSVVDALQVEDFHPQGPEQRRYGSVEEHSDLTLQVVVEKKQH